MMSSSHRDGLQRAAPSKDLHRFWLRRNDEIQPSSKEAAGSHTLEWPWHATWVCQANPAHIEVATPAEEKALAGRSW